MMKGDHTVYRPGFEIAYWKGKDVCGHLDAWDYATITARYGAYKTEFGVDTKDDLDRLCVIMDRVYTAGLKEQSKRIRDLLGIEQ